MQAKNTYELTQYEHDLIRTTAWRLIRAYGVAAHERKDIEQELALDLIRRLEKFDPTRARRTTFASRVVRHHASAILRRRYCKQRDPRLTGVSLNSLTQSDEGEDVEVVECVAQDELERMNGSETPDPIRQAALRMDYAQIVAHIPAKWHTTLELLSRLTITEAAEALGMSRTSFYKHKITPLRELLAPLAPYVQRSGTRCRARG